MGCVIASPEDHMARYRTIGADLLDGDGQVVAMVRGAAIYNSQNDKVAILTSTEVWDLQNHRVAVLRGLDVFDVNNRKIATLSDIYKDIDTLLCGPALIGLWLFFVRRKSSSSRKLPAVERSSTSVWNRIQRLLGFPGSRQPKS
jgi:hypothetical protein